MACPREFSVSLELSLSLSDRTESAGQTGFPMGFKKFLSFCTILVLATDRSLSEAIHTRSDGPLTNHCKPKQETPDHE
jgi:hypothetical protein